MNSSSILSVSTFTPNHTEDTESIIPYVSNWLNGSEDRLKRKAEKIYEMSGIDRRYSIMPIEEVFTKTSFEDKNNLFIEKMKGLCVEALSDALNKAQLKPVDLDILITVSCTGFMIPSMDAYLINQLHLRSDVIRIPITEMGCAGGTSSMIYAHQILQGQTDKKVAIVTFESPTSTFQHTDKSMTNIVSSALFGDGVAAVILGPSDKGAQIVDAQMYQVPNSEDIMGFGLTNNGLKMILDVGVPDVIAENFELYLKPFLERNGLTKKDLNHLIFHPGGRKIIEFVEDKFSDFGKSLEITRDTLRSYGNMSSSTVFFVLNAFLSQKMHSGDIGLMLSFGPGFSAQLVLLRWN